jgi:hypothetical protein
MIAAAPNARDHRRQSCLLPSRHFASNEYHALAIGRVSRERRGGFTPVGLIVGVATTTWDGAG